MPNMKELTPNQQEWLDKLTKGFKSSGRLSMKQRAIVKDITGLTFPEWKSSLEEGYVPFVKVKIKDKWGNTHRDYPSICKAELKIRYERQCFCYDLILSKHEDGDKLEQSLNFLLPKGGWLEVNYKRVDLPVSLSGLEEDEEGDYTNIWGELRA